MLSPSHEFARVLAILNVTALFLVVIVGSGFRTSLPRTAEPPAEAAPAVFTSAPSIECVQKLADLATLRVQVSDILTVDQPGWLYGYKGAWIVKGDALCVTDLNRARIEDVSSPAIGRAVRIELPPPEIRGARLDHTRTRTYDLRPQGWIPLLSVPDSVREEAMRRAQEIVQRTASQEVYLLQAQRQTEAVLTTFYAAAGYRTEIVWTASPEALPAEADR